STNNLYSDQEFLQWLHARYGFTLGLIHVREFGIDDLAVHLWPSHLSEVLLPREDRHQLWPNRSEMCCSIYNWIAEENFVIDHFNAYWAGPDGEIHSS